MEAQSGGGGASRTFHSIFARRLDPAEGTASDSSAPKTADENDDDVWDDDFPGDATMDEGNNAATKLIQTISAESRRSIEDWADDDDEEDNWRDALQARVDQLELVVEKRSEAAASANGSAVDGLPHGAGVASYGVPVDQRATLTLLSKTTLQRSVSAPVDPEQKPVSRLRAPIATRSTTLTANATNTSKAKSSVDRWNDRKNTRSKEPVPRPTLATEQKRISKGLPKTPPASATPTPGNSVFVRAVVARGPTSTTAATRLRESRISLTKDGHDEKRAKTEERADILALSDAELVRRHILSDVKKMSVERIVADAKRLHYLEDFYRRHPGSSDLMTATNTGPNPTSDRHSSPS